MPSSKTSISRKTEIEKKQFDKSLLFRPSEIKKYLDEYVIG